MAHELAHVQHRDTLTMTITATLAGAISMLGNFAFFFGGNRDNNNPFGFVGVLVAMIVAPLAAMMVQMAISRTREYAADRRGAEICGNPLWLASALRKIAAAAPHASPTPTPSAIRRRRISSSSIRCPATRMDNLSRPIRTPKTASRRSKRWRAGKGPAGQRRPHGRANPTSRPARGVGAGKRNAGQSMAPQPDRTAPQVPGRDGGAPFPHIVTGKAKEEGEQRPGLAARKTAARLLSAIIDTILRLTA